MLYYISVKRDCSSRTFTNWAADILVSYVFVFFLEHRRYEKSLKPQNFQAKKTFQCIALFSSIYLEAQVLVNNLLIVKWTYKADYLHSRFLKISR